jgi:hypothetical protein
LRAKQIGLTIADMDQIDIGMVNDMAIEENNDHCKYNQLADQNDFDKF